MSFHNFNFFHLVDQNESGVSCRHACEFLNHHLRFKSENGKFSTTTYEHYDGRYLSRSHHSMLESNKQGIFDFP